ncbi:MAG: GxxExxY protein [bacterium]
MSTNLLYAEETYKIRGAIFAVYHQLGPGHREAICEEALKVAFNKREVPFRDQVPFTILYEGIKVGTYRPDLLCYEKIILELKSIEKLVPINFAQAMSYLRVTNIQLALLVNFGGLDVEIERRILTHDAQRGEPPERNKPYAGGLEKFPDPELIWAIGNCIKRVHFMLGPGFIYPVYQKALAVEMRIQGLNCQSVEYLYVEFDDEIVGRDRVYLLVVDSKILVAPITVNQIESLHLKIHRKQMDRLGLKLGMVVNFHDLAPKTRVVRADR